MSMHPGGRADGDSLLYYSSMYYLHSYDTPFSLFFISRDYVKFSNSFENFLFENTISIKKFNSMSRIKLVGQKMA